MHQRQETLTITLHWLNSSGEQAANVICEDVPPVELIPLLLRGCGLAAGNSLGGTGAYTLRLASPAGPALRFDERVSRQGVRSGGHLWLVKSDVGTARRCMLTLPEGSEIMVPRRGLILTRSWLLQALALLNPEAHRQELERLERRESAYRYVSNRPHCAVAASAGDMTVSTARSDVATLLNGDQLAPNVSVLLRDGDRLTLGEGGIALGVALLSG